MDGFMTDQGPLGRIPRFCKTNPITHAAIRFPI